MSESTKLAGLSAELKKAKQEIKDQKARAAKQMAEFRKEMRSQRSAMLGLIKDGKVSPDVNKIDNNKNKNSNSKPKQGPKEPTKEELRLQKVRDKVKKAKASKLRGQGGGGTLNSPVKKLADRSGLTGPLRRKLNKGGVVKKKVVRKK